MKDESPSYILAQFIKESACIILFGLMVYHVAHIDKQISSTFTARWHVSIGGTNYVVEMGAE